MKGFIFSLITIGVVFTLVIVNSIILGNLIDDTIMRLEKIELSVPELAKDELRECYRSFEKREKYISLSVSHSDLTEIDVCFSEIIGAAEAGDIDEMIIIKSRLLNSFKHLRRLSGINIDSILFIDFHILGEGTFTNYRIIFG
jgi:hypothetical protein